MASVRLYYLDDLRSFAMLYGIFVHTLTLGDFGAFEYISEVSELFRMGTFFLVSGYFAGLVLERRGPRMFLEHRAKALVIPFFSALVLLNPITLWLVYLWHGNPVPTWAEVPQITWDMVTDPGQFRGPIVWHLHLWFLVSLFLYVLAAPVLFALYRQKRVAAILLRWRCLPNWLVPFAAACGIFAIALICRLVYMLLLKDTVGDPWILRASFHYFTYFAAGLLLYTVPSLWERLHCVNLFLLLFGLALWAVPRLSGMTLVDLDASLTGKAMVLAMEVYVTCGLIFFLLWLCRRFLSQPSKLSSFLSQSIYTVYLLHFCVIYSIVWLVAPLNLPQGIFFLTTALAAIAVGLLLHGLVISKSRVLTFLFNGKGTLRAPATG